MQTKTLAIVGTKTPCKCKRTFAPGQDERKTAHAWLRTLESKAKSRKTLAWYYTMLANELARVLDADILRAEEGLEGALVVLSGRPEVQS